MKNQSERKPLSVKEKSIISPHEEHLEKVLEELHLYQAELEMQNDELRIANEKLKLQQIKFAGIYDLAPIGYYILDKTGLIIEVNNVGITLLESVKSNILNNKLQSFVAAEDMDTYHIFFREMLNSGRKQSCHLKIRSRKGREFYVQMEGIAITPVRTLPLQCDIAVMDITKRVHAEMVLAKTKERLELALEASSSGTWELELDTMKFYLDEFNYQTWAIPGDKFDGRYQTFINLIHPDDRANIDHQFRVAMNNQQSIDLVCRFNNQSGLTCFASIRGHVITESGQPSRFVGIMMDITGKKNLEEEAIRAKIDQQKNIALATIHAEENERARISDALHDSVSQLLYGIRIKLRTLFDAEDPTEVMKTVYELLDMAVLETRNISFELAPSILNDFGLRATIDEMAKRLSTPKMLIKTKLTRLNERLSLPLEANIFRILQELVNNALKHSGATLITLEVKKSKSIEICVTDNGKGFDVAKQEDIASGSGLSSIKNRLSLYNGYLTIESQPGEGTVVKIKLDITSE
ncbi:PAS domain-containing protein [Mucilaginibacter sp. ZT4R22]|uniref:Oxygen sensor histidine kinase NreB n=1 Tax=Mucilaginibacter pankratovii TaxID=2772110 RepID=A0ABR7WL66_9SPHI|nr:PAS domain-containing sensor histidine kinase [Mucilaginibacter pankratovii]MBD1363050.1 PAS domain-containing protein [Mucilaginibacter pankratovii]